MTIIVGIRCADGVVVASDSQQEFGRGVAVKRLNTGKIYSIFEGRFAVAGAGTLAHIEKAVDSIEIGLVEAKRRKGGLNLTEDECVDAVEKSITATYKTYNIERSKFLEEPQERDFFNPILIGGGLEALDEQNKACLFIIHSNGIVEKISDYATAGSGAAYAELLLKNSHYEGITLNEAIPIVAYTIGEVKDIDPNCGGITRVTIVDPQKGVRDLTPDEITNSLSKIQPLLEIVEKTLVPKILRGEVDEQKLRKTLE